MTTYVIYSEDRGIEVFGPDCEGIEAVKQAIRDAETMDDMPTVDPEIAAKVIAKLSRRDGCEYMPEYFAVCEVPGEVSDEEFCQRALRPLLREFRSEQN